jgi:hypothetical protein
VNKNGNATDWTSHNANLRTLQYYSVGTGYVDTDGDNDVDAADKAAQAMVDAIRSNNCDRFVETVIVPPGMPKEEACKQELTEAYGPLRQQLTADKDAKPERLDGNGTFVFYALRTGDQYRTLIVRREQTGPQLGRYLGFVTFRGPEEART